MRLILLSLFLWASPAAAQQGFGPPTPGPRLAIQQFALPIVDYRAPDGTWKRGNGIIVGRDVAPNATVGVGFFRMKPRSPEVADTPFAGKSKKVAVGLTFKF